jgi:hypothetical protein
LTALASDCWVLPATAACPCCCCCCCLSLLLLPAHHCHCCCCLCRLAQFQRHGLQQQQQPPRRSAASPCRCRQPAPCLRGPPRRLPWPTAATHPCCCCRQLLPLLPLQLLLGCPCTRAGTACSLTLECWSCRCCCQPPSWPLAACPSLAAPAAAVQGDGMGWDGQGNDGSRVAWRLTRTALSTPPLRAHTHKHTPTHYSLRRGLARAPSAAPPWLLSAPPRPRSSRRAGSHPWAV